MDFQCYFIDQMNNSKTGSRNLEQKMRKLVFKNTEEKNRILEEKNQKQILVLEISNI